MDAKSRRERAVHDGDDFRAKFTLPLEIVTTVQKSTRCIPPKFAMCLLERGI